MLYESLSQPLICVCVLVIGFASGFVFDISNYIIFLCKNNKITKIVFDFAATICVFAIFFVTIFKLDYGNIRFYHVLIFFVFLVLQRITLGKLIAKFIQVCYNHFIKFFKFIGEQLCQKKNKTNN